MEFVWDQAKNKLNKSKHGISFEVAIGIFSDPGRIERYDARHSWTDVRIDGDILDWVATLGEDRYALINDILRKQMLAAAANNTAPGVLL